jgi:hypothetical protein
MANSRSRLSFQTFEPEFSVNAYYTEYFARTNLRDRRDSMQSQREEEQMGKGELLGEIRAKIVSQTIKEFTPLGAKLEVNGEVGMIGPQLNAKLLETINVFQKMDGLMEWEDKAIFMTVEGDTLVASARGKGKVTGPTTFWGEAIGVLITQSPKLESLNRKKFTTEVTGDRATGEYHVNL